MISIIKMLMDIMGSDAVKQLLETIRGVAQTVQPNMPVEKMTRTERGRLFNRITLQLGKRFLGLSDSQLARTMTACGRGAELQNA